MEISPCDGYRDWYWQLATVAGLSYEVLEAQWVTPRSRPAQNGDMIVRREGLARLLESL